MGDIAAMDLTVLPRQIVYRLFSEAQQTERACGYVSYGMSQLLCHPVNTSIDDVAKQLLKQDSLTFAIYGVQLNIGTLSEAVHTLLSREIFLFNIVTDTKGVLELIPYHRVGDALVIVPAPSIH